MAWKDCCIAESARWEEGQNLDSELGRTVLITEKSFLLQRCYKNSEFVAPGRSLRFMMKEIGRDGSSPLAFPGSQKFVYNTAAVKNRRAHFRRKSWNFHRCQGLTVTVPAVSGPVWKYFHRLGYSLYLIPNDVQLKNMVTILYGDSLTIQACTWSTGKQQKW